MLFHWGVRKVVCIERSVYKGAYFSLGSLKWFMPFSMNHIIGVCFSQKGVKIGKHFQFPGVYLVLLGIMAVQY